MRETLGIRGREGAPVTRTVIVVAVLLLFSLAGCGGASDDVDPFVGTWNGAPDHPDYWVISKTEGAYSVTGFITTFAHAEREGDRLTFWTDDELEGEPRVKMTVTSVGPDRLELTDAYGPGVRIPLHKVSDSTETPSPFYGRESPAASP